MCAFVALEWNWLDLEVQIDETHDEALEVLHQVIQDRQSGRIRRVLDIVQTRNFGTVETYVLVSNLDFQLPAPGGRGLSPFLVVHRVDLGGLYDSFQFGDYGRAQANLPPDDAIVLVVAVVGIT